MTDRVAGISSALPAPMTARATISQAGLVAKAPAPEAAPNSASPATRVFRGPRTVGQRAAREERAGEDQGVGARHPLQFGGGRAQAVDRVGERGDGDVQDRGVQPDQHLGAHHDQENGPGPGRDGLLFRLLRPVRGGHRLPPSSAVSPLSSRSA
ncbi:hypothetical protein ACRJ4B_19595 [Streptomyces sp. GTA36]